MNYQTYYLLHIYDIFVYFEVIIDLCSNKRGFESNLKERITQMTVFFDQYKDEKRKLEKELEEANANRNMNDAIKYYKDIAREKE